VGVGVATAVVAVAIQFPTGVGPGVPALSGGITHWHNASMGQNYPSRYTSLG
jgi:hypothetical protein